MKRLKEKLKEEDVHECMKFIEKSREARHQKTMTRQKEKLKILCYRNQREKSFERGGHSNNRQSSNYMSSGKYMYSSKNEINERSDHSNQVLGMNERKKWVINISSKPLTPDQEKLLAHGPNIAVVPKEPPIAQYVAAVEHACTKLEEGKAEEFRVQVKLAIQKDQEAKT